MRNSNSTQLSVAWESLLLWLIWIWKNGLKSCDSQMTINRVEFELKTCSPQTTNNNYWFRHRHEFCVDTRLCSQVFCFLHHQLPSPRTRRTLRGMAELQTLKPDSVAKKWQNEKKNVFGILMSEKKNVFGIFMSAWYRYQNRINSLDHKL